MLTGLETLEETAYYTTSSRSWKEKNPLVRGLKPEERIPSTEKISKDRRR